MIFQPWTGPQKRQLPTNPGAAGKGSAQQGLFLKTRAHGRRRGPRRRIRETEKLEAKRTLNLKSLAKEGLFIHFS